MKHHLTPEQKDQLNKPLSSIGIGPNNCRVLESLMDLHTVNDLLSVDYPSIAELPGIDADELCQCVRALANQNGWNPGDTYIH